MLKEVFIRDLIMKIRLKDNVYNKTFFVFALRQYMEAHIAEANGTAVKMAVTATSLGKEEFIVPPIEAQNEWMAFVEQSDKSKFVVSNRNLSRCLGIVL